MKLPKPKKVSKTKLKKAAWDSFSRYIRVRDCLKTTGTTEGGACYTCGNLVEYRHSQAGHFIPGRNYAVLFDERQVHLQDAGCNVYKHGNWPAYYKHMVQEYGEAAVREMIDKSSTTVQMKEVDLIALKVQYDEKYKTLLEGRK